MQIRLLCLVLVLYCASLVDSQPAPANETNRLIPPLPPRTGVPVALYCNITGSCKPCKPEHLQAEACRQSGHAEKLTCTGSNAAPYQVVLRLHRRVSTASQTLHMSRSCPAPSGSAAATPPATPATAAAASSDPGVTQHESDTAVTAGDGNKPHPRQVHITGSRPAGVGGLNVLYFELAMLLVLSGALPAVVIRKRRYVRL